jgi:hypothetical protein
MALALTRKSKPHLSARAKSIDLMLGDDASALVGTIVWTGVNAFGNSWLLGINSDY